MTRKDLPVVTRWTITDARGCTWSLVHASHHGDKTTCLHVREPYDHLLIVLGQFAYPLVGGRLLGNGITRWMTMDTKG